MATRQEVADRLYGLAIEVHARAYAAAKALTDPEARRAAYVAADLVWDRQREYQRQIRHGEIRHPEVQS